MTHEDQIIGGPVEAAPSADEDLPAKHQKPDEAEWPFITEEWSPRSVFDVVLETTKKRWSTWLLGPTIFGGLVYLERLVLTLLLGLWPLTSLTWMLWDQPNMGVMLGVYLLNSLLFLSAMYCYLCLICDGLRGYEDLASRVKAQLWKLPLVLGWVLLLKALLEVLVSLGLAVFPMLPYEKFSTYYMVTHIYTLVTAALITPVWVGALIEWVLVEDLRTGQVVASLIKTLKADVPTLMSAGLLLFLTPKILAYGLTAVSPMVADMVPFVLAPLTYGTFCGLYLAIRREAR